MSAKAAPSADSKSDSNNKVYFVSLGCPKNQVDTEVMLGVVQEEGHVVVDNPEEADTLVVNTCGFIEAAKEESIETILELAGHKQGQDKKKLIVAGCLSQRYPTELSNEMPEVDHFLGSADMLGLRKVLQGGGKRMGVSELSRRAYLYDHEAPRQTYGPGHVQYVKIAEGCDRPCGFCIIPKLRGPQRSRPIFSVVEEVHGLVQHGTKEICLVAQDLTTYGTDLEERGQAPANLEGLIDALGEIQGLEWIRLHYAYPTTTTDGLLDRISQHPRVASYLDVPLQHVDSDVLKKMRRGYTEKVVRDLVDRIKSRSPRIWLRTTMLVGHPGESQEAFERLRNFVAEGAIDHLGVFPWSKEDGTNSAIQPSRVDPKIAEERASEAMRVQAEVSEKKNREQLGKTLRVLVDGPSEESEFFMDGRHEGQAPSIDGKVILCDITEETPIKRGDFVQAKVIQSSAHDLIASLDLEREPEIDDE